MLFVISESIIQNMEENPNKSLIHAINYVAEARRLGNHIIFAMPNILEYLKSCSLLSQTARKVFSNLYTNFPLLGSYRNKFSRCIELVGDSNVFEKIIDGDRVIIKISANDMDDFSLFTETILLSENQSDLRLYKIIANSYLLLNKHGNIDFSYNPNGGGGHTTAVEYETIQSRRKNLCLCIADSDKKYPICTEGSTLKELLRKDDPNQHLCELKPLNIHEVENLIPTETFKEVLKSDPNLLEGARVIGILENEIPECRKYIDIKNGFKLSHLSQLTTDVIYKSYWRKIYEDVMILLDSDMARLHELEELLEKAERDKLDRYLLKGLGPQILVKVLDYYEEIGIENVVKLLSDNLKSEWQELGGTLIAWCCGSPAIRTI